MLFHGKSLAEIIDRVTKEADKSKGLHALKWAEAKLEVAKIRARHIYFMAEAAKELRARGYRKTQIRALLGNPSKVRWDALWSVAKQELGVLDVMNEDPDVIYYEKLLAFALEAHRGMGLGFLAERARDQKLRESDVHRIVPGLDISNG